jgi:hypothetical protein
MAATRRTQPLMDPHEFRRLRALARHKKTSVAELTRTAVRAVYLTPPLDRKAIVQDILKMNLPSLDWNKVRKRSRQVMPAFLDPNGKFKDQKGI